MKNLFCFLLVVFFITFNGINASISDLYCGNKNCYKILNLTNDATTQDVKKSFRALSKIYHPDKSRARGEKDTTEIFKEINQAYDVLINEELRKSYDEFLENPEKSEMYHYYNWYKARYMPQVDPRLVVTLIILSFSIIQYVIRKSMYESALRHIENTIKFKHALNAAIEEAKGTGKKKDEIRNEVRKNIKIEGGYSDPKIKDLLVIKLIILPYSIGMFFYFYIRWIVKFSILKHPYGDEEKIYMIYKNLNLSESQWKEYLSQEQREYFISLDLWNKDNFKKYAEEQEKERQEKFMASAKYKKYQRFLKNKK